MNMKVVWQEIYNICKNHLESKGCPLKTQDMNIGESTIRCENKEKNNGN